MAAASAVVNSEVRIEDNKLFLERKWFHRGQPVYVESRDNSRYSAVISAIQADAVSGERDGDGDGTGTGCGTGNGCGPGQGPGWGRRRDRRLAEDESGLGRDWDRVNDGTGTESRPGWRQGQGLSRAVKHIICFLHS